MKLDLRSAQRKILDEVQPHWAIASAVIAALTAAASGYKAVKDNQTSLRKAASSSVGTPTVGSFTPTAKMAGAGAGEQRLSDNPGMQDFMKSVSERQNQPATPMAPPPKLPGGDVESRIGAINEGNIAGPASNLFAAKKPESMWQGPSVSAGPRASAPEGGFGAGLGNESTNAPIDTAPDEGSTGLSSSDYGKMAEALMGGYAALRAGRPQPGHMPQAIGMGGWSPTAEAAMRNRR